MRKKIIIGSVCLCILGLFLFFYRAGVYEETYDVLDYPSLFYDDERANDRSYDVYVTDTEITFYDSTGNSVIYIFDNDRLKNVFNVYNAVNEVEARKIAAYFNAQVGDGEILKVKQLDNAVSVQMDMNYFSDYKGYTKKQLEEILLKDANVVEGE